LSSENAILIFETDAEQKNLKGKISKRRLFLFNNLLLVTKCAKGKIFTKHSIPLDNCLVWEGSTPLCCQLVRTDSREKVEIVFQSTPLKESFMNKINETIANEGHFTWNANVE